MALLLVLLVTSAPVFATTIPECQAMIDDLFAAVENDANFLGNKKKAGQNKKQITRKLISARGKLDIEEFGAAVAHIHVVTKRTLHFLRKDQLDLGIPHDPDILAATAEITACIEAIDHEPPENRAPTITSTPVTTARDGDAYSYAVTATDPDGDNLGYMLIEGPDGMTINPDTGLIEWTPQPVQVGERTVVVDATDGREGTARQSYGY